MSSASREPQLAGRTMAAFLSGVIGVAVVGYFVGINDGVPKADVEPVAMALLTHTARSELTLPDSATIPALSLLSELPGQRPVAQYVGPTLAGKRARPIYNNGHRLSS